MFCVAITFSHYFQEYKTGGLFCPPSEITGGGGKTIPPVLCSLSIVITFLAHKTGRCILTCIDYIFNRGLMPLKPIS